MDSDEVEPALLSDQGGNKKKGILMTHARAESAYYRVSQ